MSDWPCNLQEEFVSHYEGRAEPWKDIETSEDWSSPMGMWIWLQWRGRQEQGEAGRRKSEEAAVAMIKMDRCSQLEL